MLYFIITKVASLKNTNKDKQKSVSLIKATLAC